MAMSNYQKDEASLGKSPKPNPCKSVQPFIGVKREKSELKVSMCYQCSGSCIILHNNFKTIERSMASKDHHLTYCDE